MAKQLQLRRGTTVQHNTFTGAVGEVTIDTDKDVVVVHDGSTVGGFPSQKELVSGTNIKTVNSTTLLGSGNIAVQPTLVSGTNIKTINNSTILGSGNLSIGVSGLSDTSISSPLSGQVLSYNGVNWANVTFSALPSQSGQSGKYLTTDGSNASWATLNTSLYMNDDTIPVGSSQTIPTGKQIVVDHLDVQGTLDIQGTLATVTGGYLSQTTMKTQEITHTNGTNAMTIDSSGNVMLGSNYLTPYTGFKNRIINGDMKIDQRNSGSSFTCGSNNVIYGLDRWTLYSGSSSATGQRISNYGGFQNAIQITGASGNAAISVGQRIEQANSFDLAGQTIAVSFTASSSTGRNISVDLAYPNAVDNYGSGVTAISNTTVAVTTSATRYTLTFNVPSAATTGLRLEFAVSSLGAGQTFTVTGVQLEKGSVATPFEHRPYGLELSLCQRYFETGTYRQYGANNGVGYLGGTYSFKATKRATPTISVSGQWGVSVATAAADTISTDAVMFSSNAGGSYANISAIFTAAAEL